MWTVRRKVLVAGMVIMIFTIILNLEGADRWFDGMIGIPWSSSIVAFLKQNTQGLIVIVLLTLWYEYVGLERPRQAEREERKSLERFFHTVSTHGNSHYLIRRGIESQNSSNQPIDQLVNLIATPGPVINSCSVRIHLRQVEANVVEVRHHAEFEWDGNPFRYAIVDSSETLNRVNSVLPDVLETTVRIDSKRPLTDVAAEIVANSPFTALPASAETARPIALNRVSGRELRQIHKRLGTNNQSLILLESVNIKTKGEYRLRVSHLQRHAMSTSLAWWMADRPTYVSRIYIDATGLGDDHSLDRLLIFCGNFVASGEWISRNCWEATNVGWMVSGQGVVLHWQPDAANVQ